MGKVSQTLDFSLKAILIATSIFVSQAIFDKTLSVPTVVSVALSAAFAAFLSCMLNLDSFNRVPVKEESLNGNLELQKIARIIGIDNNENFDHMNMDKRDPSKVSAQNTSEKQNSSASFLSIESVSEPSPNILRNAVDNILITAGCLALLFVTLLLVSNLF